LSASRLLAIGALLVFASLARAQAAPGDQRIELIELRSVPLGDALKLLSQQTELKMVASAGAAETPVSLYLRDVTAGAALEALTKAHNLWYREDEQTNIIRVYTVEEYRRDLLSFREETTEVFTLLYPNAIDVGVAIRDLFGDRVQLSLGIDDQQFTDELEDRFERFGLRLLEARLRQDHLVDHRWLLTRAQVEDYSALPDYDASAAYLEQLVPQGSPRSTPDR